MFLLAHEFSYDNNPQTDFVEKTFETKRIKGKSEEGGLPVYVCVCSCMCVNERDRSVFAGIFIHLPLAA